MKKILKFAVAVFVAGCLFSVDVERVEAFDIRGGTNVTIGSNEVIKESVLAGGERVEVLGRVEGDVICAGQNVRISGEVTGDVICVGQHVEVAGIVGGDVRVAGQWVNIEGKVRKNVSAFGQNVVNKATTGGEMLAAGQNVEMNETLGGGMLAAGESVNVDGKVEGNVKMWVNRLRMGEKSEIKGNLWYESENELENGGKIGGKVERVTPPVERTSKGREEMQKKSTQWKTGMKGVSKVGSWLVAMVLGLMLVGLWPKHMSKLTLRMRNKWGHAMLVGLAGMVVIPLVAVTMMITIVGIPFGVSLLMLFALAMMMTSVWSGLALGDELVSRFAVRYEENKWVKAAGGITVLCLLMAIPVLGWIFKCAAGLWGMGGWWYLLHPAKKAKK